MLNLYVAPKSPWRHNAFIASTVGQGSKSETAGEKGRLLISVIKLIKYWFFLHHENLQ